MVATGTEPDRRRANRLPMIGTLLAVGASVVTGLGWVFAWIIVTEAAEDTDAADIDQLAAWTTALVALMTVVTAAAWLRPHHRAGYAGAVLGFIFLLVCSAVVVVMIGNARVD